MPIVLVGVKVGAAALPSFEIEFTALDDDETYTNERKFSSSSFLSSFQQDLFCFIVVLSFLPLAREFTTLVVKRDVEGAEKRRKFIFIPLFSFCV